MRTHLTFVIPIRHPDNAHNPVVAKKYLQKTLASIAAQTVSSWKCIVVANQGTLLPEMPNQCQVCYVDLPPNNKHNEGAIDRNDFYEAVRIDKGKRVLAGMLFAPSTDYFMVVDDDDFVHRDLCKFVSSNSGQNGWYIKNGCVWGEGSNLVFYHDDFNHICGTSNVIRSDLFSLPENMDGADMEIVKSMLGSHFYIQDILENKGAPLAALPFRGAMYRVDNVNAHSRSSSVLTKYIFNKWVLRHPRLFLKNILSLRLLNKVTKENFWGLEV